MVLVSRAYNQDATLWRTPVSDGAGGWSFNTPKNIMCRWEAKNEQFTAQDGEIEVSNAIVFTKEVVKVGEYLFLGESTSVNPETVANAFRIRQVMNIPSLRTSNREIRAFL